MRFDQRAPSSSARCGKAVGVTESVACRMRLGLLFVALLALAPSLLLAKVTGNISGTVIDICIKSRKISSIFEAWHPPVARLVCLVGYMGTRGNTSEIKACGVIAPSNCTS